MTTRLRADVFPATVQITGTPGHTEPQHLDKVRVTVTADAVYIWADSPSGPTLVLNERLQAYSPPVRPARGQRASQTPPPTYTMTTDSGRVVEVRRTSGCGCGSRLKTFNSLRAISELSPSRSSLTGLASSRDS